MCVELNQKEYVDFINSKLTSNEYVKVCLKNHFQN